MPYCLTIQDDENESQLFFHDMRKAQLKQHDLLVEKINDYSRKCDEISIYFGAVPVMYLQNIVNTIIKQAYADEEHKYEIILSQIVFEDGLMC